MASGLPIEKKCQNNLGYGVLSDLELGLLDTTVGPAILKYFGIIILFICKMAMLSLPENNKEDFKTLNNNNNNKKKRVNVW